MSTPKASFNFLAETLSEKDAATSLDMAPLTLRNYRLKGAGPRFTRINARNIRYKPVDIMVWLESRTRTPKQVRADLMAKS